MGGDYEDQPFISLDDSTEVELSTISTHLLTEQEVVNMDPDRWCFIENSVREKFPPNTMGLCEWRYCFPCTSFRPPRAHHCSVCNACVLRMDHHCPWVGNCVGHKNHKLFWNFLLNSTLGCLFVSVHMIYSAVYISFDKFEKEPLFLITMIAASALVFSLSGLLGYHTYLIVNNLSTLEMG
jgi:hypothetical protein